MFNKLLTTHPQRSENYVKFQVDRQHNWNPLESIFWGCFKDFHITLGSFMKIHSGLDQDE